MKFNLKRVLPFALATTAILLSSCSEKSECNIPTRHVHRYTKEISDEITIESYFDNEHLSLWGGYKWNEDYIEINKVDEALYKILNNKKLFDGATNWSYLFNVMASKKDYLMFYYYYTTIETYTTTDSDGEITTHTRVVEHSGWHSNPNDSDNTGKTRLYHHRFYGYRVIYENGKFKLEQSPAVDDIRDIINDYPYFSEDCVTEVYETFKFSRYELGKLSPKDFDTFTGPDLSNPNLNLGQIRERTN